MTTRTYNLILIALLGAIILAIDALALSIFWQHEAIKHHAAHFEVNSWGVTSYHWNDEHPFIDPANPTRVQYDTNNTLSK